MCQHMKHLNLGFFFKLHSDLDMPLAEKRCLAFIATQFHISGLLVDSASKG